MAIAILLLANFYFILFLVRTNSLLLVLFTLNLLLIFHFDPPNQNVIDSINSYNRPLNTNISNDEQIISHRSHIYTWHYILIFWKGIYDDHGRFDQYKFYSTLYKFYSTLFGVKGTYVGKSKWSRCSGWIL